MENHITKTCRSDWDDLDTEFQQLDEDHRRYQKTLEEVIALQKKCASGIAHHRYRLKQIQETLKPRTPNSVEEKTELTDIQEKIKDRKQTFREMEESLPHKNGLYLSIILGQVNISLLSKADKYRYKQEYERFKLVITYIIMVLSLLLAIFQSYRWVDAILHFLLVWYYCTLTIRESILVVNGSRIKGWWLTHHFISTVCAGITLIWPDGESYRLFRKQYAIYSFYLSVVQVLQYYYQSGCLYRLKTLGERHDMDITVEGFMSWMWKGLAFLLPFVFFGYFFQLYNVYVMYKLSLSPRCRDWQVTALAIIHFVLFLGNMLTTCRVVRQKIQKDGITYLKKRYRLRTAKKTE